MFNTSAFINFRLKHLVEYDLNNLNPNDADNVKKYSNYYSNYEDEAKRIYDSLDDLKGYLLEVVTKAKQDSLNQAEQYYNKRLLEINEYELAKERAVKIDELKLEVVNIRKGHILFKSIVNDGNEKELIDNSEMNDFTSHCFALHIARMINYSGKVMFIADFHNKINEWFLYETLFKRFNEVKKTNKNVQRLTIPKYALFYYYIQVSREFPMFEKHPKGKVKAIEELLKKEGINTTSKYFQLKYNFINNHKTNRIALNQAENISYVIKNMLKDYPKAKEIAQNEYNLAIDANR